MENSYNLNNLIAIDCQRLGRLVGPLEEPRVQEPLNKSSE